ncbi:MAG: LCP family protein [Oscillospiraceae bacterium]|nr:LCP family protein [Oscillospiraceae bacterium]
MNRREREEFSELEELLWRAEEAAPEQAETYDQYDPYNEFDDFEESEEFEYDEYDWVEFSEEPDLYEEEEYIEEFVPQPEPRRYHRPRQEEYPEMPKERYQPPRPKKKKARRRRGCGCGCLTWLLGLIIAAAVAMFVFIQPPISEESIGSRKPDTATILVCGTDADGMRTDTMMLLYLSGSEGRVGLLSLPRDSYTITASGSAAKLNSAYGRNGGGEEGMEVLMDYVQRIIGYRPDGYILMDFTLVPQIVDIMGGVEVDVPMDMEVEGTYLTPGFQRLSGQQVLAILRFRAGYATADLGRVEMQRTVLKACMQQWLTPTHIGGAVEALSLLESGSTSTLTTGNYLWMAKAMLLGMRNLESDTLPGVAEYRDGVSYYILNRSKIAALINESYNPYQVTIDESDLNIAN